MRSFVLPFLTSFLLGAMLVPGAFAQQGHGSIVIEPLLLEMEVENDKSYLREVMVTNKNSVPYEVTFEAFDVEVDPETHAVRFLPSESKNNRERSLASWVVPESSTTFVILPDQEIPFRYHLSPPVGAISGDYYGSLNFYYKPVSQQQNGNIKIRQSLGCLMLVALNGDQQPVFSVSPYTISPLAFETGMEETEVVVDFQNDTLRFVHLKPSITLKDATGEIYFQKDGLSKRVFPGENAKILHSFPNVYLTAEEPLTMYYTLWDKAGKVKFYEETASLDRLRMAPGIHFPYLRTALIWGTIVLLISVGVIYWMRFQPRARKKSSKKIKGS